MLAPGQRDRPVVPELDPSLPRRHHRLRGDRPGARPRRRRTTTPRTTRWRPTTPSCDTIALGDLMLTDEQRLLLLALAEGTLRDPHSNDELPTNRAVARRLGWSITKFNRKLDNLCNRFSKLGVGGLRGSIDQLATDRRRRLVEHAVESGLIARSQLSLLPAEAGLSPGRATRPGRGRGRGECVSSDVSWSTRLDLRRRWSAAAAGPACARPDRPGAGLRRSSSAARRTAPPTRS